MINAQNKQKKKKKKMKKRKEKEKNAFKKIINKRTKTVFRHSIKKRKIKAIFFLQTDKRMYKTHLS